MAELPDLPLFGGAPAVEPATPATRRMKPRAPRRAMPSGERIVALPLALNRRVVADLVALFQASPPGPHRAIAFRRDVLTPLVKARLAIGLSPARVEVELDAIEEAMVRRILAAEPMRGRA